MHLKSGPSGRHIRKRTHKGAQKRKNVQAEIHDRRFNNLPPENRGGDEHFFCRISKGTDFLSKLTLWKTFGSKTYGFY